MHKNLDDLFKRLWEQYTKDSPHVLKIYNLFKGLGEQVHNDHVAFRTFNHPKLGIKALAREFERFGYEEKGEYNFEQKKLFAKHYQTNNPEDPKIFISELKLEECSNSLQEEIHRLVSEVDEQKVSSADFCYSGRLWSPTSYQTYQELYKESEYAAWVSAFGFRANHFTVLLNKLDKFKTINELNQYLEEQGFALNESGGKIKGSPSVFLEQSSTMAEKCDVLFSDGSKKVPFVYYEFARRYEQSNGEIYQGFVTTSADKIFESTHA